MGGAEHQQDKKVDRGTRGGAGCSKSTESQILVRFGHVFFQRVHAGHVLDKVSLSPSLSDETTPHSNINHTGIAEADIFALIRCKYSMLRRLAFRPAASRTARGSAASAERGAADVLVEVHFAGPQPSVGCGALLRSLLGGESVEAWPIELPRGRKRKDGVAEEGATSFMALARIARGGPSRRL